MEGFETRSRAIRVLIADDEPLARELLRSMLEEHDDLVIVGECRDGRETLGAVRDDPPDILFLDIQMPELDGFGVLHGLPTDRVPIVIFVTAYDQYALRAFEVHALDYLLKPFDEDRLATAVARARQQLALRQGDEMTARMMTLFRELQERPRFIERVVIKENGRAFLQPVREVDWFEADGKYIRVHVGAEVHTIREGMTKLEQGLDPTAFIRISRSAIVNIERIRELRSWFQGDYVVVLKSGKQITSTRGYRDQLQSLLGRGS